MTATLVLGAMPGWAIGVLVAGFLLMCVLLVLTVLIQRPQGGGLAGAFGGAAGSGQTAFGAKTGDALTVATITMFAIYILLAIGLNYALAPAAFGCAPERILFVSSNGWDAAGAGWYGFTTFWINRGGQPGEALDIAPTATGRTMDDVVAYLIGGRG